MSNYNVKVYNLEGKKVKEFINFPKKEAIEMYSYYNTLDEYVVKVDHEETFYKVIQPKIKER